MPEQPRSPGILEKLLVLLLGSEPGSRFGASPGLLAMTPMAPMAGGRSRKALLELIAKLASLQGGHNQPSTRRSQIGAFKQYPPTFNIRSKSGAVHIPEPSTDISDEYWRRTNLPNSSKDFFEAFGLVVPPNSNAASSGMERKAVVEGDQALLDILWAAVKPYTSHYQYPRPPKP